MQANTRRSKVDKRSMKIGVLGKLEIGSRYQQREREKRREVESPDKVKVYDAS